MIPAVVERCAGIDVHKKFVVVCVLVGAAHLNPEPKLRKFGTINAFLYQLRDWLLEENCKQVAMESTGPYWRPVFNILEEAGIKVTLANPQQVKNLRVSGEEALRMGLANRLVEPGKALESALEIAHSLAAFPQGCLRADRLSAYEQWSLPLDEARRNELRRGLAVLDSGESRAGASRFAAGAGRHGAFGEAKPN